MGVTLQTAKMGAQGPDGASWSLFLVVGRGAESHHEETGVLVYGCKTWIPTLLWLHLLIQIWHWIGKMKEGTMHYLIFWDLLGNQSIPWDSTGNSYMFSFLKWVSQVALVVKNLPANAGDIRDAGFTLGGGHSNPLHSCLEDPMDRGAWDSSP